MQTIPSTILARLQKVWDTRSSRCEHAMQIRFDPQALKDDLAKNFDFVISCTEFELNSKSYWLRYGLICHYSIENLWKPSNCFVRNSKLTSCMSTNKLLRWISMGIDLTSFSPIGGIIVQNHLLILIQHVCVALPLSGASVALFKAKLTRISTPPEFRSIWWWKCNFNLLFIDDISSHIIALFCDIANLSEPYSFFFLGRTMCRWI